MNNNLNEIMSQGRTQTLEHLKLSRKQLAGTLTEAETTRLALLTGSLTQLATQAMGLMGMDENGNIAEPESDGEDLDDELDADELEYDDNF